VTRAFLMIEQVFSHTVEIAILNNMGPIIRQIDIEVSGKHYRGMD
jgi:hypothetical protein